jgi:hypothetical protein
VVATAVKLGFVGCGGDGEHRIFWGDGGEMGWRGETVPEVAACREQEEGGCWETLVGGWRKNNMRLRRKNGVWRSR